MARLSSFSWNESLDLLFLIRTSSFHSTSGSNFGKVSVPDPNLDQNLDSNLDPVPDLIQHSFRTKFLHNLPF